MDASQLTVGSIASITPAPPGWAAYVGQRTDDGNAEVHTMPIIGWGLVVSQQHEFAGHSLAPVPLMLGESGTIYSPNDISRGGGELLTVAYGFSDGQSPPQVVRWIAGEQQRIRAGS